MARFRYHRESFRRILAIAIGLTLVFCGVVWLLLGIYGVRHMNWITAGTGVIFFAFISARMLAQYLRDETVLAVQPVGLYDARISSETIPWENIKELVLIRREQDYSLRVVLWPERSGNGAGPIGGRAAREHEVDLSVLEQGARSVLEAIQHFMPVRLER
ncbi:MAG: hypothetical protein KDJ80_14940 [Nitratireductor sp.]|nr:hypothetical protein [Nitratireductor sp.]